MIHVLSLLNLFFNIFHGMLASLFFISFFYLLGISFLPKEFFNKLGSPLYPGFLGAFLCSLFCWYSIKLGFSLFIAFKFLLIVLFITISLRFRTFCNFFTYFKTTEKKILASWISIYIILYLLVYSFLPQPFSDDYLPITRIVNNDIFDYMNYANFLTHLGTFNLQTSYLVKYYQTPAVFHFMAFFSEFYTKSIMLTTMPILYTTIALIGTVIAYYSHRAFLLSKKSSLCIAAIVICGPFFRYIGGNYFLSSLIGMLMLLVVLIEIDKLTSTTKNNFLKIFLVLLPYEGLLLFSYSGLFLINIALQIGFIILILFYKNNFHYVKKTLKEILCFIIAILLTIFLLALLEPGYIQKAIISTFSLANVNAGWHLKLLSPFSIIGLPVQMELISTKSRIITLSIFAILLGVLVYRLYKQNKQEKINRLKPLGFSFLFICIITFVVYVLYFYKDGTDGYQPWKFASYYVLPFCATIWAATLYLCFNKKNKFKLWHEYLFIFITFLLVIGNTIFSPFSLEKFDAKYKNLEALDSIGGHKLWIKMNSPAATFLSVYFLQNKELHLLSAAFGYYPQETFHQTPPHQLVFIETTENCALQDNGLAVNNVGCLYEEIPLLKVGKNYSLNTSPLFLETEGFASSDSDGQWTSAVLAKLTFYISEKELLKHPVGYINFEVQPFLYPGLTSQNVTINWGKNKTLTNNVASKKWLSVPYNINDWKETPSQTYKNMTIEFYLPNAISPLQAISSPDNRILALKFIQFSATLNAKKY